jgi:hypothetical protein
VSPESSRLTSAGLIPAPEPANRRAVAGARIMRILGSVPMTIAVVVVFALQATWVAVSARFVMYDEQYHLAAIKVFSTRWTPFIHQSAADGPVGDIERYGSYLYHYLLSFPYRAARALELSDGTTLVALRLVSVLAVAGALVYAWRLFRELGAGPVTANIALTVVAMMPLTVFLAGALNYDNLLAGYSAHGCRWAGWVCPGVAQQVGQWRRGESSASSNACRDRAWSSVTSWWSRRALSNQSW